MVVSPAVREENGTRKRDRPSSIDRDDRGIISVHAPHACKVGLGSHLVLEAQRRIPQLCKASSMHRERMSDNSRVRCGRIVQHANSLLAVCGQNNHGFWSRALNIWSSLDDAVCCCRCQEEGAGAGPKAKGQGTSPQQVRAHVTTPPPRLLNIIFLLLLHSATGCFPVFSAEYPGSSHNGNMLCG